MAKCLICEGSGKIFRTTDPEKGWSSCVCYHCNGSGDDNFPKRQAQRLRKDRREEIAKFALMGCCATSPNIDGAVKAALVAADELIQGIDKGLTGRESEEN